ncbi:electron transport complex subunit RsxC [Peptoniphilus sp. KCTC 25270]|uniref:electron transport complex subunit RsxC n=1 Tax=Peptoniphilus sp. KCTC 25270 TaxID=2897414 RepID=UPI001E4BBDB3|nr:electron transport complex subunit RsxC [Peptoniphilus sp. KCTC 25270]MCD1147442.1 electron transport complex subunit RsxC [Peptoniphilus sp. KCTC 25270]
MPIFNRKIHGGVHVPKNKDATKNLLIELLEAPKILYFPMSMHIGEDAKPVVKIGDIVKVGTKIGEAQGGISANIHSSVSGKVVGMETLPSFRGEKTTLLIENDGKYEEETLPLLTKNSSPEEFQDRLRESGITGKGGAGFPTSVKYDQEKESTKYLVVNGAECEPFSTTDHRVMVEFAQEVVDGVGLICDIYELEKAYIALEKPMTEAIASLENAILDSGREDIVIHLLDAEYPQGHANLQIEEVINVEVEEGKRPGHYGILQSNVSTVKAMYDACLLGKPLTHRVVTVTGPKLKEPKNLMVPMGTPVSVAIESCGGLEEGEILPINGGPMMGKSFENYDFPIDKDTTTLLFMDPKDLPKETPCIQCAQCIEVCPVGLQPVLISNSYKEDRVDLVPQLQSESCISCGSCTYICPARIPLLENIQALNNQWKEAQS